MSASGDSATIASAASQTSLRSGTWCYVRCGSKSKRYVRDCLQDPPRYISFFNGRKCLRLLLPRCRTRMLSYELACRWQFQ
jgi:hypothetical protein